MPKETRELNQRLLVVAHCSQAGHRGIHVMVEILERRFAMAGVRTTATRFVNSCKLRKHVKGGEGHHAEAECRSLRVQA